MAGKYAESDGKTKKIWHVDRLWKLAEDIEPVKIPIEDIVGVDAVTWFSEEQRPTVRSVAQHAKRIYEADLSYPPLLTEDKKVFDGMHRIARHLLLGHSHLEVKIFPENPPPDEVVDLPPKDEG